MHELSNTCVLNNSCKYFLIPSINANICMFELKKFISYQK